MARRLLQLRRAAAGGQTIYTLVFSTTPNAGTLVLSVDGDSTANLGPAELDAAILQGQLEGLPAVGVGGVMVTGDFVAGLTLTFAGPQPTPVVTANTLAAHVTDYDEDDGPWSSVVVHTAGVDPTSEAATVFIPPGEIGTLQFAADGSSTAPVEFDGSDDYAAVIESALENLGPYTGLDIAVASAGGGNWQVTWPAAAGDVPNLSIVGQTGFSGTPSVTIDLEGTNGAQGREDVTLIADGGRFRIQPESTEYDHPLTAAEFEAAVVAALGVGVAVTRVGSGPGYVYQVLFDAAGYHDPGNPDLDVVAGSPALYRADPVTVVVS